MLPSLAFLMVVLVTITCSGFGMWLALDAAQHLNRPELGLGFFIMLPGSIVVAAILGVLFNRLPRERARQQAYLKRRKPEALAYRIKKTEKLVWRMQFLKRHPSVVFLLIVVALLVLTAMALCPESLGHIRGDVIVLHLIGIVFGLAYILMLVLFLWTLFMKRWETYMDASIAKLEPRLVQLRGEQIQLSRKEIV